MKSYVDDILIEDFDFELNESKIDEKNHKDHII